MDGSRYKPSAISSRFDTFRGDQWNISTLSNYQSALNYSGDFRRALLSQNFRATAKLLRVSRRKLKFGKYSEVYGIPYSVKMSHSLTCERKFVKKNDFNYVSYFKAVAKHF